MIHVEVAYFTVLFLRKKQVTFKVGSLLFTRTSAKNSTSFSIACVHSGQRTRKCTNRCSEKWLPTFLSTNRSYTHPTNVVSDQVRDNTRPATRQATQHQASSHVVRLTFLQGGFVQWSVNDVARSSWGQTASAPKGKVPCGKASVAPVTHDGTAASSRLLTSMTARFPETGLSWSCSKS